MGRTPKGHPGFYLFKAVRLPPAKYAVISTGALPVARRLTTALNECKIGVCKGTSAASIRCCIRSPVGPAAVSLGNERKIAMRLISDGIEVDVSDGIGAVGHSFLGCLVSKSLQVSSLLGARPVDTKVWQALLYKSSWASEIADVTCCFRGMSLVRCSLLVLDARDNAFATW